MRKLILLFILLTTYALPQKKFTLFDDDGFSPLSFDKANLIALYDGDKGLQNDQSVNNYDLTLINSPIVVANAINGHTALRFDGVNQYARRTTTPVLTQPFTYYLVVKQITWTSGDYLFSSEGTLNRLYQVVATPTIRQYNGAGGITAAPTLNQYYIITNVVNGANSQIRLNDNAATTGSAGTNNSTGIFIGANGVPDGYGNIEVAYVIFRKGVDDAATQNKFINYLKTRFGL